MFLAYNLILFFLSPLLLPFVIMDKMQWFQRLGFVDILFTGEKVLWIHCASVGEVNLIKEFIKKLKWHLPEYKIVLSVLTPSGYELAQKLALPVEKIFYLPLDFWFCVRRVFKMVHPDVLLLVETELWPNLIDCAEKFKCKVVLVNGRISNKNYKFYRMFKFFSKRVLKNIDLFLMRERADAGRIITLGADSDKVVCTGNMKFDFSLQSNFQTVSKNKFGFGENDKIFVAGSVREGEEKLVISAYLGVKKKFPNLKFIIAPRHLNRLSVVKKYLEENNIKFFYSSELLKLGFRNLENSATDCTVIDTYGDLVKAYSVADVVFVGGSLAPFGGHNILEPASLGKAVIFGHCMDNFKEPTEVLKKFGGGIEVKNVDELVEKIILLLSKPEISTKYGLNAKNAVLSMAGATDKNIEFIKRLVYEQNSYN